MKWLGKGVLNVKGKDISYGDDIPAGIDSRRLKRFIQKGLVGTLPEKIEPADESAEIKALAEKLANIEGELDAEKAKVSALEKERAAEKVNVDGLKNERDAVKGRVAELEKELKALKKKGSDK